MKVKNIYSMVLLAGLALGFSACEDEVLVETKDETKANEILAAIAAADTQLATLSVENNTLVVSNEEAEALIEQYEDLIDDLDFPYSEPKDVHYTVTVLSSANTILSGARTKGFEGATVVVEQNGLVLEPSSVSGGMYLFTGLKQGYVYVRISAPDHTSVEYRAYIYKNNGDDVDTADAFNAQSQVVLFPISGEKAARIEGYAYANTTVLNDTLNRRFGSAAAFGANANTFVAPPNGFTAYDYTYNSDVISQFNIYGTSLRGYARVAGYENALAGHKIYAYPGVDEMANNDYTTNNGRIYEIIYKGLVTSTTIASDGSYSLPVISSAQYDGSGLANSIQLSTDEYVAPHTRFTTSDGQYYGQTNEAGSEEVEIKYYNNTNADVAVYNGDGTNTVVVTPATAATVKRRVITEDWVYVGITQQDMYINSGDETMPVAGEVRNLNIYFQPRYRD